MNNESITYVAGRFEALVEHFKGAENAKLVAGISTKNIGAVLDGTDERNFNALLNFFKARENAVEIYDEHQLELIDKVEWLIIERHGQSAASSVLGLSAPTVSNIRKGTYAGNVGGVFSSLEAHFKTKAEKLELYNSEDYVPTSIAENIQLMLRYCQIKGCLSIITGTPGVGKTEAIKKFTIDHPTTTIMVTAKTCHSCKKAFLKMLGKKLGVYSNTIDDLWNGIADKLHDGMLIIVDEAQKLNPAALESLRDLVDEFTQERRQTLGVALVGNSGIREIFSERKISKYGQLKRRTREVPDILASSITIDDIKLMFPILTDNNMTAELKFLHQLSLGWEGFGAAVEVFSEAYNNNRTITLDGLAAVAVDMQKDMSHVDINKLRKERNR